MKKTFLTALSAAALISSPLWAADKPAKPEYPSPPEIVAKAKAEEWVAIAPSDLLVMDLAPDAKSKARRVVIQLIPQPFSQGWVGNIRKLAAAKWWDGTSINRVQDNYVVQWGDATEKKALPEGLEMVPESEYEVAYTTGMLNVVWSFGRWSADEAFNMVRTVTPQEPPRHHFGDSYAGIVSYYGAFPVAAGKAQRLQMGAPSMLWPVHCYGMVGVGRNLSPDTGTGAELYTVIGHAPRHLDRNIALVGRVIEGIEHLSSLPRGTGPLGFYEREEERVPINSVRLGNAIADLPMFEYLSTDSASFVAYANARASRRDAFFIKPAGGADICNIPVPIRRKAQ